MFILAISGGRNRKCYYWQEYLMVVLNEIDFWEIIEETAMNRKGCTREFNLIILTFQMHDNLACKCCHLILVLTGSTGAALVICVPDYKYWNEPLLIISGNRKTWVPEDETGSYEKKTEVSHWDESATCISRAKGYPDVIWSKWPEAIFGRRKSRLI